MSQKQMIKMLLRFLIQRYGKDKVFCTTSYLMAEGDYPVMLVAHMDTVGLYPPTHIFYDPVQFAMWSPELLGADDRAGIYAIMQIIEDGYRPSILFTTDEELGGLGAYELIKDYPQCPFNLHAIIELDRQGERDCVFYDCANEAFEKYITKLGFTKDYGTFTDISIIAPKWGIAAVNLSVGYLYEHTRTELLFTNWLEATITKVEKMLKAKEVIPFFPYIPAKKKKKESNAVDLDTFMLGPGPQLSNDIFSPLSIVQPLEK